MMAIIMSHVTMMVGTAVGQMLIHIIAQYVLVMVHFTLPLQQPQQVITMFTYNVWVIMFNLYM